MSNPTTWFDKGGCRSCDYCGMDMDMDPYCIHPTILKDHKNGLNINYSLKKCRLKWHKKRKDR